MKLVAEYLERALHFERLAGLETDLKLKAQLLNQAQSYRKMAADRALRDELKPPQDPK